MRSKRVTCRSFLLLFLASLLPAPSWCDGSKPLKADGKPAKTAEDKSSVSLLPRCTLTASQETISAKEYVALVAQCAPVATTYTWVGVDFPLLVSAGTVAPEVTTTYSVIGRNAAGEGESVSVTVSVPGTTPAAPVPVCTLTATPASISPGTQVNLAVQCRPAADKYLWSPPVLPETASSGTVSPSGNTTYAVSGKNAAGTGNLASASVTVPGAMPVNPASALGDWPPKNIGSKK